MAAAEEEQSRLVAQRMQEEEASAVRMGKDQRNRHEESDAELARVTSEILNRAPGQKMTTGAAVRPASTQITLAEYVPQSLLKNCQQRSAITEPNFTGGCPNGLTEQQSTSDFNAMFCLPNSNVVLLCQPSSPQLLAPIGGSGTFAKTCTVFMDECPNGLGITGNTGQQSTSDFNDNSFVMPCLPNSNDVLLCQPSYPQSSGKGPVC